MEQTHFKRGNILPLVMTLMAFMVFTSACGSKKSAKQTAQPVNNGFVYNNGINCTTNCNNGGSLILRTHSIYRAISGSGQAVLDLDILGQYSGADSRPSLTYNGPVYANGVLIVTGQLNRLCGIAPGQYQLSSVNGQPGNWQSASVSNLRLVANGNAFSLVVNALEYHPIDGSGTNFGGKVIVERAPNQPCDDFPID